MARLVGRVGDMRESETFAYGPHRSQQLDLWLAGTDDTKPLVVVLHGGFWRPPYDRGLMQPLALDLVASGYPLANVDYRRVGESGGGWPGTFEDVREAVRLAGGALPRQGSARERPRDCAVVGHSAGATLALWLAGEAARPFTDQVRVRAAISLAGVTDLRASVVDGLGQARAGAPAAVELLGGSPVEREEAYRAASPIERVPVPAGLTTLLVHGDRDELVPLSQSTSYADRVHATGGSAELHVVAGMGHFEVIDPSHASWRRVIEGLARLTKDRPEA